MAAAFALATAVCWDGWRFNITQERHVRKHPRPSLVFEQDEKLLIYVFLGWKGHLQGKPCATLLMGLWGRGLHRSGAQIDDI